jgi:hypothetical protein
VSSPSSLSSSPILLRSSASPPLGELCPWRPARAATVPRRAPPREATGQETKTAAQAAPVAGAAVPMTRGAQDLGLIWLWGPDDGRGSASSDYGGRGAGSSASSRSRRLWGPTATTIRPTRDPDQLRLRGAQRRRLGQLQLQGPQRHLRPPSSR